MSRLAQPFTFWDEWKVIYSIRKPGVVDIERRLAILGAAPFTYESVGATRDDACPPGYVVDRTRVLLGHGPQQFDRAAEALLRWKHYQFDWIELHRPSPPIHEGQVVGVLARALGLWVLNACRVVYVLEEESPELSRVAFAYGTLPQHAASGEERFQVEWHRDDDSVWYEILAFSRPVHLFARIGYPYLRRKQKQFGRESTDVMVNVCKP